MHLLYADNGWVRANDLRTGMDCYLGDGSRLTVQHVKHPRAQKQTVYNPSGELSHLFCGRTAGVGSQQAETERQKTSPSALRMGLSFDKLFALWDEDQVLINHACR